MTLWGARIDGSTYGRPGDAPWDATTWNLFEQHAGKKVSLLHFGQPPPWLQGFAASPFQKCVARGAIPLCSMDAGGASLVDIAAGKFDTQVKAWAQAAAAFGKTIWLRPLWEMNNPRYESWGPQAAVSPVAFVAAWKRLSTNIHPIAPNVLFVWCPNVVFPGSTPLASLYPGNEYVDLLGIDGYNWGSRKGGWKSFGEVFAPTYVELLKLASSKRIVLCEVGCSEVGGNKPQWIADMFQKLPAYSRVGGLSWFNWPIVENGVMWDWPIESSQAAQAAFRAGVADPRYEAPV